MNTTHLPKGALVAGVVLLAWVPGLLAEGFISDKPNVISFQAVEARLVRLVVNTTANGQVCIDEFEVYGPGTGNLALASAGAKASASSALQGYPIHQTAHLNDGKYGNDHSWIAAGSTREWAQIELPKPARIEKVVLSRDRSGRYRDRVPDSYEIRVSADGQKWATVFRANGILSPPDDPADEEGLLRYAFSCENATWTRHDKTPPAERVIGQMEEMVERFARRGIDVSAERKELEQLKAENAKAGKKDDDLYYRARLAKRRLFLRDPDFEQARRILLVKRYPFEPSHNYSVIFDSRGGGGGSICTLEFPTRDGRLDPTGVKINTLFESGQGIARNPVLSLDGKRIFFSYRTTKQDYFRLMVMNVDGSDVRQITDGPFHDYFPCPLPDGGLAFMSTRCKARFLCWRPQAFVMFRMDAAALAGPLPLQPGDPNVRPLSFANLSEWTPSLLRDGRIMWMRSEYLDKGANFGHTLWAIRPDGSHPELIFGNNTIHCYANGNEIPGSREILCTLVSHGGDLNGPIGIVDPAQGIANVADGVRSITPDIPHHTDMSWPRNRCFRDPMPVTRDLFLCSHAAADRFALYAIDRYGNREILHMDAEYGCMHPSLFRRPPGAMAVQSQIAAFSAPAAPPDPAGASPNLPTGHFVLADVYHGLEPAVQRGRVKYLRICEEVRANLIQLPNGAYQADHEPFQDWYATPVHKVSGPFGWPSYVAKAVHGLVPVEADGSANFIAPAGRVLYFQALDEDYNEIQRMRSVVQLQPDETRSCLGCHENRSSTPRVGRSASPLALHKPPATIQPPSWGAGAFAFEKIVQPVLEARCVRCHDAKHKKGLDFTRTLDANGVPRSYRTLIEKGLVHYFNWGYGVRHHKADALTFGSLKSKLWEVLDKGHNDVKLTADERHRIKCWTDLNCPLWPDYIYRPTRLAQARNN